MNESQSPKYQINTVNSFKCVILAAGASTRLRPLTDSIPKCLLAVGGKTLLERTIENVFAVGIQELALIVGYRAVMIREFVKQRFPQMRIRCILNPHYARTNNAYSLLLARKFLEEKNGTFHRNMLLLDGDILFSEKLLPAFLEQSYQELSGTGQSETRHCHVAVRVSGEHNDEEIRVKVNDNGDIVMIGKNTPLDEAYGESIGIESFPADKVAHVLTILEQRIRRGVGRTEFYEASFQEMIDRGDKFKAVDISAFPAMEIDTKEDFERAKQMLLM